MMSFRPSESLFIIVSFHSSDLIWLYLFFFIYLLLFYLMYFVYSSFQLFLCHFACLPTIFLGFFPAISIPFPPSCFLSFYSSTNMSLCSLKLGTVFGFFFLSVQFICISRVPVPTNELNYRETHQLCICIMQQQIIIRRWKFEDE